MLVERVRAELLPMLGHVREEEQDQYRDEDPAEAHMEHLIACFETLKVNLGDDPNSLQMIEGDVALAKA
jgi:hypothetical protein